MSAQQPSSIWSGSVLSRSESLTARWSGSRKLTNNGWLSYPFWSWVSASERQSVTWWSLPRIATAATEPTEHHSLAGGNTGDPTATAHAKPCSGFDCSRSTAYWVRVCRHKFVLVSTTRKPRASKYNPAAGLCGSRETSTFQITPVAFEPERSLRQVRGRRLQRRRARVRRTRAQGSSPRFLPLRLHAGTIIISAVSSTTHIAENSQKGEVPRAPRRAPHHCLRRAPFAWSVSPVYEGRSGYKTRAAESRHIFLVQLQGPRRVWSSYRDKTSSRRRWAAGADTAQ